MAWEEAKKEGFTIREKKNAQEVTFLTTVPCLALYSTLRPIAK